jgi:C-terminal processing protease CtpA/Prc
LCASGQLAPGSSDDKLGYVRIATFSKQTTEKVREALTTLKEEVRR